MYRCGGTKVVATSLMSKAGLSPRVRGNRTKAGQLHLHWRSIPACAGEPSCPPAGTLAKRVYPRVCGGTTKIFDGKQHPAGLSPRVRGNHQDLRRQATSSRSIPACAGEPVCSGCHAQGGRVYPRVCGGTFSIPTHGPAHIGLSPRVRGNPAAASAWLYETRSIPACAGEPLGEMGSTRERWVYPRVCGGTKAEGDAGWKR